MKLLNIINKNFKLLFRSKSSAFVVTIGPLIIIILIALAFSNSQGYHISVGVVVPDESELSKQFVNELKEDNYTVSHHKTIEGCIQQVKIQSTNLCIKLPKDFVIANNKTNEIEFYVDQSRMNIVESIISSVSSTIDVKSEEITMSLTQNLLNTIGYIDGKVAEEKVVVAEINSELDLTETKAESVINQAENNKINEVHNELAKNILSVESINISTTYIYTEVNELIYDLNNLIAALEDTEVSTRKVRVHYDNLEMNLTSNVDNIRSKLTEIEKVIANISQSIDSTSSDVFTIKEAAKIIEEKIILLRSKIDLLENSLDDVKNKIDSVEITSAENIINPTTIKINPLLSSSNRSTYLFPYFVTLIILFVGVMLSSTLVVMEKKSRAFFRTFTTPTNELYHILARYLTNIIILTIQLIIIFTGAYYYLDMSLAKNYTVIIPLLLLSITFFIFLGQMIGYLFKTQEGVTIASISLGSLFLFLSNVILPIESFPEFIRNLLIINPYMLCSELLKKAILFQATLANLKGELMLLIIYIILVFGLSIVFQKISFTRFFKGLSERKILRRPHITAENYFRMEDGTIIKSKADLLKALKKMKNDEFKLYVNDRNNEFHLWITETFKEKLLAKIIKKAKTREMMIKIFEYDLNRHTKK